MSDLDLVALRALAEAATAGPWAAYFTLHGDPLVVTFDRGWFGAVTDPMTDNDLRLGILARVATSQVDYGRANCEFMAAADPVTVLALINEVVALRSTVAACPSPTPVAATSTTTASTTSPG